MSAHAFQPAEFYFYAGACLLCRKYVSGQLEQAAHLLLHVRDGHLTFQSMPVPGDTVFRYAWPKSQYGHTTDQPK